MIKAAIIGCGRVGGGYDDPSTLRGKEALTHGGAYYLHPRTELVACCDIDEQKVNEFSRKWSVPLKFLSVDEFFSYVSENIDILTIATPDKEHYSMIKRAVELGVPVVICEKPISQNIDSCMEIIDICQKGRTCLTVNMTRQWAENIKGLKGNLESGIIGDLKLVNAFYSGGVVHNGIHLIDMFYMLFGNMRAFEIREASYCRDEHDLSVSFDFLVNTNVRCVVHGLGFADFDIFEIDIIGTEGRLVISDFTHNISLFKKGKSKIYDSDIELLKIPYKDSNNFKTTFYNLVDEAVMCMEEEKGFSYKLTDIKRSMETVFVIKEKAERLLSEEICQKN